MTATAGPAGAPLSVPRPRSGEIGCQRSPNFGLLKNLRTTAASRALLDLTSTSDMISRSGARCCIYM